ncbi:hypothetical protein [Ekhidna sp.]|uniref:hypothetical protein n=1 Tax=Ekhidna sp. TaxID=2608089 RepID=UPI003B59A93B
MIISHKYKYVFIGLPFSASSAISKELIEQYDGEPILEKHSNAYELKTQTSIDLNEYRLFACIRNPIDIAFSQYSKFLNNPGKVFETKKYFRENGGHITKADRKWFRRIQLGLSFDEFLKGKFKLPVDTLYSYNHKYLDFVINFHDLNDSFKECIKSIGLTPKRDLPVFNKTGKKIEVTFPTKYPYAFKPFLATYGHFMNVSVQCNPFYLALFKLLRLLRIINWKRRFSRMKHDIEAYKSDKYYQNVAKKRNE